LIISAVTCFGAAGCNMDIVDPQVPIAGAEAKILLYTFIKMLVIVVPTLIAMPVFA
jgi:hypothetical protein